MSAILGSRRWVARETGRNGCWRGKNDRFDPNEFISRFRRRAAEAGHVSHLNPLQESPVWLPIQSSLGKPC